MGKLTKTFVASLVLAVGLAFALPAVSAEPTKEDLQRWNQEFMSVVKEGEKLFHSSKLGKNNVSCDQCHPNATNTHAETYPKFQKQIGKVISLFEMVNWCLRNPLEGDPLAADDPKMIALLAYMTHERRGVPLSAGKH